MGISWQIAEPTSGVAPGGSAPIEGLEPAGLVTLPAELYPPAASTGMFLTDSEPTIGVNQVVLFPGMAFAPPSGMVAVIDSLSILVDGIVITTNVQFSIAVNGALVPGFSQLALLPRTGATFAGLTLGPFLRIPIPLGGKLTAQAVNVDGGAYNLGMQARGWFWPASR